MGVWTVEREVSLRYQYSPNTSGRGRFGGLSVTARPDLDTPSVVVVLSDQNPDAARWLPDIEAGIADFEADCKEDGNPVGFLRIEIDRVLWHETDTWSEVIRRVAYITMREIMNRPKITLELPVD